MAKKNKNVDLSNLPSCAAEFIELVIKRMKYRRKVQQDVQAELAAHFEDELKSCTTTDEKEQKARKLVAEFGDVETLAILLRRAKKRCRPLWRTVVARTFQTIGILILCFAIYTIWFLTGKPAITVDYLSLLNDMSRPQVRDEDNAWPHYQKAINLYVEPVRIGVVEELLSYRNSPSRLDKVLKFTDLNKDEQAKTIQWIKENQKYWDNLTAEQKAVVLKCFQFNSVPVFKKASTPRYITFNEMTTYIIDAIKQSELVMDFIYANARIGTGLPKDAGFPDFELTDWTKYNKIPPNFLEAVSVAVLNEWMKRYNDLPKSAYSAITDTEYEYLSTWMKSNEAAWQEFVTGSLKSYCYKEYSYKSDKESRSLFDVVMPHLNNLKRLARFGILHCHVNLKEGKIQQALEDCLAVARAGSHWQRRGTIVEQLVGIAISALSYNEIINIAGRYNLSANELKHVQQQLSEIYAEGYPLVNLEFEKLAFQDIVQHVFTDRGHGGGHLVPKKWSQWIYNENDFEMWKDIGLFTPFSTAISMVHVGRDETLAKANEFFDRSIEIAKITPYERHISKIENSERVLFTLPRYRYFLIHNFAPALDRVSEIMYRCKTTHEATVTILALKRWKLENNEYPERLDKLTAVNYLKELPIDPFSNKPLVYKRMGNDFILYSFSYNFTDDGGEPGKDAYGQVRPWRDNGDMIFWPVRK
ncbi:MAG: hypothetical protein A2173_03280 [Planctomycetes bacterium RBG_13_44_8b]|nr:MAG: hypothetical protein A2173_03280 [Planctomycetes bacterium RBG_13_44_8b]